MGRRAAVESVKEAEAISDEPDGARASNESRTALTSAQRLAASAVTSNEVAPDPFALEAKHFTEMRVLNRDVSFIPIFSYYYYCIFP